jgi:hypothetical protein
MSESRSSRILAILLVLLLISGGFFLAAKKYFSRSINLNKLTYLLENEDWENADRETDKLILSLSGRRNIEFYYFNPYFYDLDEISCAKLLAIDDLWKTHSHMQYGFSTQADEWKRITSDIDWDGYNNYLKGGHFYGNPEFEYNKKNYENAYSVFRQYYNSQPSSRIANKRLERQSYPSNTWIFEGSADGEDVISLLNKFIQVYERCAQGVNPPQSK